MAVAVGKAIYYRLANDATVAAKFGTRISPADRETFPNEQFEFNAIIFSRVAGEAEMSFDLTEQVNSEVWQIDVYSVLYADAQDYGLIVKDLFHGFQGAIDGQTLELVLFDGVNDSVQVEHNLHRVSLSFRFYFNN